MLEDLGEVLAFFEWLLPRPGEEYVLLKILVDDFCQLKLTKVNR